MESHRRQRLKRWVALGTAEKRPKDVGGAPPSGLPSSSLKELLLLAWPIAAAMAGETAIGLVDTKLVGGLGAAALGAVGIANTLMFLSYALVLGVMRGVKIRTAYAVGRGTPADGLSYAKAGMLMGAVAGVGVWFIARDVTWALVALRVDPALVPFARDFFAAITWGSPATCVMAALIQHRQGLGDARTPMIVGIAGNVVNAVLAWSLIYGHLGLPALGVRGAGYGTATTEMIEALIMIALLLRDHRRQLGPRAPALPLRLALQETAELGVPTGVQFGAEMLAFTAFTAILGGIGGAEIAAHQIALATIRTSFLPGIAVGEAASVLVGRALAQRRLDEADRVTRSALLVAMVFMGFCGLVFAVFGGAIARAFTPDPEVAAIARRLLLVAAVFQVLDGVQLVFRGALRGAKDVRVPAYIGIAVVWTCVPGAALLLGKMAGWGALGGWCGFIAETILASALLGYRWSRGAWRVPLSTATTSARNDHPIVNVPIAS